MRLVRNSAVAIAAMVALVALLGAPTASGTTETAAVGVKPAIATVPSTVMRCVELK